MARAAFRGADAKRKTQVIHTMKTTSRTFVPLLAALGVALACSLPAAPAKNPPAAFPVKELRGSLEWSEIKPGATEQTVRVTLGSPLYRITDTLWVYHQYEADREDANRLDCHNLLVTFDAKGRVESLKLTNDEALAVLKRRVQANLAAVPEAVFVAKQ